MTHIVAEPCIGCKHTDCATVCPSDCFHEGPEFVVIDPKECIDCGLCTDVCPVSAIFSEDELPDKWSQYREINESNSKTWPVLSLHAPPMSGRNTTQENDGKENRHGPDPEHGDQA